MKKSIWLILFSLMFPVCAKSFVLRDQGELLLGITGGYGFPQLGFWGSNSVSNTMNKSSKEYSFGLLLDTFLLNNLALSTEVTYTYNTITMKQNDTNSYNWDGHFVDISLSAHGYWFEFLYFGGGLYGRIPYRLPISNAPNIAGNIQFTMGLLMEVGVDMKFFDSFGLRIGVRSHIPFMAYHTLPKNNYNLWTFPINFTFALEWIIK